MKDEAAGEVPVAFVVRANGSNISEQQIKEYISKQVIYIYLFLMWYELQWRWYDLQSETNQESMHGWLNGSLMVLYMQVVSYKRINRVFFTDDIPKAPTGKILRKSLRSRI